LLPAVDVRFVGNCIQLRVLQSQLKTDHVGHVGVRQVKIENLVARIDN
jgi:hypothetical protein